MTNGRFTVAIDYTATSVSDNLDDFQTYFYNAADVNMENENKIIKKTTRKKPCSVTITLTQPIPGSKRNRKPWRKPLQNHTITRKQWQKNPAQFPNRGYFSAQAYRRGQYAIRRRTLTPTRHEKKLIHQNRCLSTVFLLFWLRSHIQAYLGFSCFKFENCLH